MKHLKLFAALCCCAALFAACDKTGEPKTDTSTDQPRDTVLYFNYMGYDSITPENVQRYLDDKNVANVYLEPNQPIDFVNATTDYITALCEQVFKPAFDTDPERVHGRGNFLFYPGEALPADSLWLVSKGWTVNKAGGDEIEKHDVEIEFAQYHYELLAPDTIKERLSHLDVRNVILVPSDDDFTNVSEKYMGIVIDAVFQPAVDVAPDRVFGRGNLRFKTGVILEKDSLWLVQHGWAVNPQH